MSKRTATFRPRLDVLEDRTCPSTFGVLPVNDGGVSITTRDDGHTLVVRGNDQANSVIIDDADGNLAVSSGVVHNNYASSVIKRIEVDLGDGNDYFTYQSHSTVLGLDKRVFVNMGAGNDQVRFDVLNTGDDPFHPHLPGTPYIGGKLDVTVDTGSGSDTLFAQFGVVDHGELHFRALMGGGNDSAYVQISGVRDGGAASVHLRGQAGNDDVEAELVQSDRVPGVGTIDLVALNGPGQRR